MDESIRSRYRAWCESALGDPDLVSELAAMAQDEAAMADAFYRDLAFGTGGLRGVIGAGTNRMNIYTVAKASQGLANHVLRHFPSERRRIAISYDSRIKSDLFARTAAGVFAQSGIEVYIYPQLMPTPCLSYAVRALGCAAGIMVTASHNPAKYNGYKVYGADGCQITTEAADEILREIERLDIFSDVHQADFDACLAQGRIRWIPGRIYDDYIQAVRSQSVLTAQDPIDRDVSIVYTPLNGTGLKPVTRALRESGFTRITVVPEQAQPDGHFPTCPYPNPEIREAMALGIACAQQHQADLLLATDPDCDRAGIAVRNAAGEYVLLTGNETGMLLLDFICACRTAHHTLPDNPVMIKTIVTTDMAERIAAHYGVRTINVLTGFKFIGEQIGLLEKQERADSYLFGFEESYGYLSGSYVRDKDAVNAALLICEMFAFYKAQGITLPERLNALYAQYGYCLSTLHSYTFEGAAGFERMQAIMRTFRGGIAAFGDKAGQSTQDYLNGLDGLPPADVIKFRLANHCSVVVRPSGTEPKLKAYVSVSAADRAQAAAVEERIAADLSRLILG